MENVELRMENYRNKMLRILSRIAAAARYMNRFFVRKRVHSFSILNFPLKVPPTLTLIQPPSLRPRHGSL